MSIAEKLTSVAENVPKVFAAGYAKGVSEGGGDSCYDEFWDSFQSNGKRPSYSNAFSYVGWNDTTFKPKYDIKPTTGMSQCFYNSEITDLVDILEKCGVVIDTSNMTGSMQYGFGNAAFTRLPVIDVSKSSTSIQCFYHNRSLKSIEKIIMSENTVPSKWFSNDTALENLTIEGTIGQNGFNVQWSTKLSGESIVSIIEALSSATSGLTVTLSQTAVSNMTFPITSKQTNITYDSWATLIATKSNWTISLA